MAKTIEEIRAKQKEWRDSNKEYVKSKDAEYKVKNLDKIKERLKEYRKCNRDMIREQNKKYGETNREILKVKNKERYAKNKDKLAVSSKEYREANKEHLKQVNKTYREENKLKLQAVRTLKLQTNHIFRFTCNTRMSISMSFRRFKFKKKSKTTKLLGCSLAEFREFISCKFSEGMTLENHGTIWHLDHIVPLAFAKKISSDQEMIKKWICKLCHHTNYQPLFIIDNLRKSDTLSAEAEILLTKFKNEIENENEILHGHRS